MSGSKSLAIRERAINFIEKEGGSKLDASKVLGVCVDTINRWIRRYKEQGNVKPDARIYKIRKVDIIKLKQMVDENPDATLEELAEPFGVYPSTIDYHLRKLNITRKKNNTLCGARREKA